MTRLLIILAIAPLPLAAAEVVEVVEVSGDAGLAKALVGLKPRHMLRHLAAHARREGFSVDDLCCHSVTFYRLKFTR